MHEIYSYNVSCRESLQGIREAGGSLAKGYRIYSKLEAAQEADDDVDMVPAEWSEDLLINVSRLVEQVMCLSCLPQKYLLLAHVYDRLCNIH